VHQSVCSQIPLIEDLLLTFENAIPRNFLAPFEALGITNLLPIQEYTFRLCTNPHIKGRFFISYETGQGKTALCLALAASKDQ
jgi:hypothetical protein